MTPEAAHSFLVVAEGPTDPETIAVLADRVACAEQVLHARGQGVGLSAFLDELREHLAPCYVKA